VTPSSPVHRDGYKGPYGSTHWHSLDVTHCLAHKWTQNPSWRIKNYHQPNHIIAAFQRFIILLYTVAFPLGRRTFTLLYLTLGNKLNNISLRAWQVFIVQSNQHLIYLFAHEEPYQEGQLLHRCKSRMQTRIRNVQIMFKSS
jgi:hypothetical protein